MKNLKGNALIQINFATHEVHVFADLQMIGPLVFDSGNGPIELTKEEYQSLQEYGYSVTDWKILILTNSKLQTI